MSKGKEVFHAELAGVVEALQQATPQETASSVTILLDSQTAISRLGRTRTGPGRLRQHPQDPWIPCHPLRNLRMRMSYEIRKSSACGWGCWSRIRTISAEYLRMMKSINMPRLVTYFCVHKVYRFTSIFAVSMCNNLNYKASFRCLLVV